MKGQSLSRVGLGRALLRSLSALLVLLLLACEDPATIERVRELQQQGKFEASLEPLRALLEESPEDPELNYRYGVGLGRTGSPDRAIWALRKAAQSEQFARVASLELGMAAISAGEWTNAIEIADALLDQDPDDVEALRIRGEGRLSGRTDFEGALYDFDQILEFTPDDLDTRASRAATLIALGRVDEAGEEIEEMTRVAEETQAPEQARSRVCTARALFANEQAKKEEAEEAFRACLEAFPQSFGVVEQFVQFLDGERRHEEATELLIARLEERPASSHLRVNLSQRLVSLDQFEEAEALLRDGLVFEDPAILSDTWAGLTDVYVAKGELDEASRAYEKSFELMEAPGVFERFILADILARADRNDRALEVAATIENETYRGLVEARVAINRGEPKEALARLDEILPLWPNNAGARYWAARAAEQVGDFDRAIEEYRQSIRSSATYTEAGLRLGRLHEAEGAGSDAWSATFRYADEVRSDREAARLMTRIASRYGPDGRMQSVIQMYQGTAAWPSVVAERADLLARWQSPERAVEAIRSAPGIALDRPRNAPVLDVLVRSLVKLTRVEDAESALAPALERTPDDSELQRIRGWLSAARGQKTEALASYERALELDPRNARAWLESGRLVAESGDPEGALERWNRATELDPMLGEAYVEAAQLLAEQGRTEEAEERWSVLLREVPWDAGAAVALARSRLARGEADERTLELARRSIRFGAGEAGQRLLARVHAARGDKQRAAEIRKRLEEKAAAPEAPAVPEAPADAQAPAAPEAPGAPESPAGVSEG